MNDRFIDHIRHEMGVPVPRAAIERSVEFLREYGSVLSDVAPPELGRQLAVRTALEPGRAVELFHVVCRTVDGELDPMMREEFRKGLPDAIVDSFDRTPEPITSATGHTLASGRPGSRTPLSSSSHAHSQSLAETGQPRTASKIATSRGMTQERLHRTLAEGKPGSTRPISSESD